MTEDKVPVQRAEPEIHVSAYAASKAATFRACMESHQLVPQDPVYRDEKEEET